ncbi:MAG: protein adenylyltransferase Fic [Luteolibacter sp.]
MSDETETADTSGEWRPELPFDRLPLLPPEADLESKAILRQCIEARAAVAELKQAALLIPNQSVLINTLPLLEARASSEIENIVTTADRLFQFSHNEGQADSATKEALRYSHALLEGFRTLADHPLNTRTAEEVCSKIKGTTMTVRRVPGTTLANDRTGEVIYTPPVGEERLRDLLANWERFLHERVELDPLIRLAAAHYQFEAIHPFTDGNGRTGRILNSLFIIQENLLTLPILYLSRHIITHKVDYYRLLLDVTRHGAWEPWVLFMLSGIADTARWTTEKIAAIRSLQEQCVVHVRQQLPRIYSRELVDAVFEFPYCRISNLTERGIAKRQTASVYLKELVRIGVLTEKEAGRERIYINPRLMQLLTRDANDTEPYAS